MDRITRYLYIVLAAYAVVAFTAALRAFAVGSWIDAIASVVFIALILPQRYALAFAVSVGVFSELHSPLPFGTLTALTVAIAVFAMTLQRSVFTNFSVYTAAITGGGATLLYALLLSGASYVLLAADIIVQPIPVNRQALIGIAMRMVGNTAAVTAAFLIGTSIMRTLNRAFIAPHRT